jgi:CBS domain-containing protein
MGDSESEDEPQTPLVQDMMATNVSSVDAEMTVREAASVMAKKDYGCLVVVSGKMAIGIITERDIVRKVTAEGIDPDKVLTKDVMSSPLITVSKKASILEVAEQMKTYNIRRVIVIDDRGALAGLVSTADFATWLAKEKNFSEPALRVIARMRASGTGGPYE